MTVRNYDPPLTKYSRRCKKVKPASEFYTSRWNKDGMHSYCKPCSNAYNKAWSKRHPTYDRDRMRRKRHSRLAVHDV